MKIGDVLTMIESLTWSDTMTSTRYILLRVVSLNPTMCDTIPKRLDGRRIMLVAEPARQTWLPGDCRDMPFEAFEAALALT